MKVPYDWLKNNLVWDNLKVWCLENSWIILITDQNRFNIFLMKATLTPQKKLQNFNYAENTQNIAVEM